MWLSLLLGIAVAQDRPIIPDARVREVVVEISQRNPYTYVVAAPAIRDHDAPVAVLQMGIPVGVPVRSDCAVSEPLGMITLDCRALTKRTATLVIGTDPQATRLPPAHAVATEDGDSYYLIWISSRPNFAIDIPTEEE